MAIIKPEYLQPTEQQRNEETLNIILDRSYSALLRLAQEHKDLFVIFWRNPNVFCDMLGTKAKSFFEESRRTQTYLYESLGDDFLPFQCSIPSDKNVVENQDGSVTITNKE